MPSPKRLDMFALDDASRETAEYCIGLYRSHCCWRRWCICCCHCHARDRNLTQKSGNCDGCVHRTPLQALLAFQLGGAASSAEKRDEGWSAAPAAQGLHFILVAMGEHRRAQVPTLLQLPGVCISLYLSGPRLLGEDTASVCSQCKQELQAVAICLGLMGTSAFHFFERIRICCLAWAAFVGE